MTYKKFIVGGAVRDFLLGIEPKDRDYVVVGAEPNDLLEQGFSQVGKNFPVFLHPETGEEYALARKERKVAPGYSGFDFEFGPHITLEEDLGRRDLSINSMAMSDNQQLIDPYNGLEDLRNGILRHTSEAFAEDPLRILRVARFASRYDFKVAPETIELSKKLINSGELHALSTDRVWTELIKILKEKNPTKAIKYLHEVGAFCVPNIHKLLYMPQDYNVDFYKYNLQDKINLFMKLHELDQKDRTTYRVDNAAFRANSYFYRIVNLCLVKDSADDIVDLFNNFRDEMQYQDYKNIFVKITALLQETDIKRINDFENNLELAWESFQMLDIESAVVDVDKKDIKNVVKNLKVESVYPFFKNEKS